MSQLEIRQPTVVEQGERTHIALLYPHIFEDVGDPADLLEELVVSEFDMGSWLIGLPDDGGLVGVLVGPSVDAVVGGVQTCCGRVDGDDSRRSQWSVVGSFAPDVLVESDGREGWEGRVMIALVPASAHTATGDAIVQDVLRSVCHRRPQLLSDPLPLRAPLPRPCPVPSSPPLWVPR